MFGATGRKSAQAREGISYCLLRLEPLSSLSGLYELTSSPGAFGAERRGL